MVDCSMAPVRGSDKKRSVSAKIEDSGEASGKFDVELTIMMRGAESVGIG